MSKKIVGIVGGMGPEATADLFMKIIKATPAQKDQDHIRVILDSNTDIPDRTKAILGEGPSPVSNMTETVNNLIGCGAEILVMPCNTAHYFYSEIATVNNVEFLHMMRETVKYIREHYPNASKVGILATTGTVKSELYHKALEQEGLMPLVPIAESQEGVMEAIYAPWGIKAGKYERAREYLQRVGRQLIERGAEVIIMGCTEIPLALQFDDLPAPLIDATEILARAAVKAALAD